MTRKNDILDAALEVAADVGYNATTRRMVANRAGVSLGLVRYYMPRLRWDIVAEAAQRRDRRILAQALVMGDYVHILSTDVESLLDEIRTNREAALRRDRVWPMDT
jgi:AcrR family transcriptional regulator